MVHSMVGSRDVMMAAQTAGQTAVNWVEWTAGLMEPRWGELRVGWTADCWGWRMVLTRVEKMVLKMAG